MSAALLRFWWVVAIGVVAGIALAISMIYEIPSFTPREPPVYTATARLFVTSSEGQYIRLSVPRTVDPGDGSDTGAAGASGGPAVLNVPPNVQPLLAAANLYPLLIESDAVASLREDMFGPLPGTVRANAFSAVSTPQRYSPAQIPVIDIFATSGTPRQAIELAEATADAFTRWVRTEQNRADLKPEERILIQELRAPRDAFPIGGASYGIPTLIALAVMAAFGMLAVVLDQIFPRRAPAPVWESGTS